MIDFIGYILLLVPITYILLIIKKMEADDLYVMFISLSISAAVFIPIATGVYLLFM